MQTEMQDMLIAAVTPQGMSLDQLLYAAASPDPNLKSTAESALLRWAEQDNYTLLIALFELLKHPQVNTHILAYSYLLNHIIIKPRRCPGSILTSLEQVYIYYYHNHPLSLNDEYRLEMRVGNLVKMAAAYLSKPLHKKERHHFVTTLSLLKSHAHYRAMLRYTRRVLEEIRETMTAEMLVKDGALLNNLLKEAIYEMCSGDEEEIRCAIAASYFLSLFPSIFMRGMVLLLDMSRVSVDMIWVVLQRLGSAFTLYRATPELQLGLELLSRLRTLFIEAVGWEKCEQQQLRVLMSVVEGIVVGLLRVSIDSLQHQQMLQSGLLNIETYRVIVDWMSRVSMLLRRRQLQSSYYSKCIARTIGLLNERMPEQQLQVFFGSFRDSVTRFNLLEVMLLLSGTPRNMQNLFGIDEIFGRVLNREMISVGMGHMECGIVYEFVSRYVSSNPFLMVGHMGLRVEEWVRQMVLAHQSRLQHCDSGKEQVLLLIGTLLKIYLNVEGADSNKKISFLVHKSMSYLTSLQYAWKQVSNEMFYQILLQMANNRPECHTVLSSFIASFYGFTILTIKERRGKVSLPILATRIQYQMLSLLSKGLSDELVKREPQAVLKIIRSIAQDDPLTASQLLVLLGRVLHIINKQLLYSSYLPHQLRECLFQRAFLSLPLETLAYFIKEHLLMSDHDLLEHYISNANSYPTETSTQLASDVQQETVVVRLMFEAALFPEMHPMVLHILTHFIEQEERKPVEYTSKNSFEFIAWKRPELFSHTVRTMLENRQTLSWILELMCLQHGLALPNGTSSTLLSSGMYQAAQQRLMGLAQPDIGEQMLGLSLEEKKCGRWSKGCPQILKDTAALAIGDRLLG